jgi:pimeloyl-ACP methyl ester carboxylesterase
VRTTSADGISIAFRVFGRGQPALVFVHGWCCDQSYWDAQVDHFAQQYTVVTIDLAGHGESGLGRESWTMEAFGEDVVAVVRKLHLDQVVLIGHSMGGHVIVEAARRMPSCVIGLVGADTFSDVERRLTREEFDEEFASIRASFSEATRELVRSMFAPTADSILVERIAADMSEAPPEIGLRAVEEATRHDLARALEEVQAPIRCISSDGGTMDIEAAQRHTSSFEVVYMSRVGHFVMIEDPETFNRLLAEIVAEFVSYQEPTRLSPR